MRLFATLFALSLPCTAFADLATPASSEPAVVSPRHTFRVEQPCQERPEYGVDGCEVWLVSTRNPARRVQLPERGLGFAVEVALGRQAYDAGRSMYQSNLHFSPDERYLLREQKVESGTGAAYLYERVGELDYRETAHPDVDEAARDLFARQVGSRHAETSSDEGGGIVELVAWGVDGRSLVVSLRAREIAGYYVVGWQCTVDIATGRAYVTPAQAKANAGTFGRRPQRR
jgi:hypothetical protein